MTRSLKGGDAPVATCSRDEPIAVTDDPPVVLNAGGSGVVPLALRRQPRLAALADHMGELEELERATLVADSWALLLVGQISCEQFFAIARGLGDQDEPDAVGHGGGGRRLRRARALPERAARRSPRTRARALRAPVRATRLGRQARRGRADAPAARHRARRRSARPADERRYRGRGRRGDSTPTTWTATSRDTILRIVADQDRPGDYETFLERYSNAATPQDEQRYLRGVWRASTRSASPSTPRSKCFN